MNSEIYDHGSQAICDANKYVSTDDGWIASMLNIDKDVSGVPETEDNILTLSVEIYRQLSGEVVGIYTCLADEIRTQEDMCTFAQGINFLKPRVHPSLDLEKRKYVITFDEKFISTYLNYLNIFRVVDGTNFEKTKRPPVPKMLTNGEINEGMDRGLGGNEKI